MANDVEITVRVSNQTGGGVSAITAQMNRLRQSTSSASRSVSELRTSLARTAAMDVSLNDHTEHGVAAVRARIAELRTESPVRLAVEFRGDAAQIAASANAMRELNSRASSTGTAMSALTARATAAAAALLAVRHGAEEASGALRELRARAAAAAASLIELRAASTGLSTSLRSVSRSADSADNRMESLGGRTQALRNHMDDLDGSFRRAAGSMGGLRANLGTLRASANGAANGQSKLIQAAVALAPALIPVAAAVAPVAAGLGAAAVAVGAFGAALIPQILALGKASEAEKAYAKAVADHGRVSAAAGQAENEWLKQVQQSSPEVRKAAASLSVMKEQYKAWSDGLASSTLPVATKSFAMFGALFPKLTPLVQGASVQLSRFVTLATGGIQSAGFDRFMATFSTFATETLAKANSGFARLITSMDAGKMGGGFAEFMRYAKENGPAVAETLGHLVQAMGRLLHAAADTGVSVLSLVNAFAELINAMPLGLLTTLVQLAVAFNVVKLAAAGMAVIGPLFTSAAAGASAFVRAARFGGVASAIQGVTQSLSAMQKASIALAVLTAAVMVVSDLAEKAKGAPPDVDRLTTSLKKLGEAGKFTGELKSTFGDMDGFVRKVNEMKAVSEGYDKAKSFTSLIPMGALIDKFTPKLDQLVNGTKSLPASQERFKAFDESFANLAKSGHGDEAAAQFTKFETALRKAGYTTEEITQVFPGYKAAVADIAAEQDLAARSMGVFGEQAVAVQAKLDLQKQSANGLAQSLNALNEVYLQARGGVRGMEAAIDAATEALKQNGANLDENTEKGRANNQALDNLAAATMKAVEATLANGQGWDAAQAIWERGRGQLLASAEAMGLTEAQARSLAAQILATPDKTAVLRGNMEDLQAKLNTAKAQLASVPDSRKAEVRANIADLEAKIARAQSELYNLSDRTVYIRTIYQHFTEQHPGGQAQAHGGIIGAAGGGPRSRMTLVGEQGPELVDLAPGSRVRSNPDSRRIADGMAGGGGGGGAQPVVIQLHVNGRVLAEESISDLRKLIRVQGGNVQSVLGAANR